MSADRVDQIPTHSGLEDSSLFSVSYASRIFTVVVSGDTWVWVAGSKFKVRAGTYATTAHANTTGQYFCYYDDAGDLTVSSTAWTLSGTAPVAMAYFNATTGGSVLFDERHPGPTGMSDATHINNHFTRGTQLQSGGVVSGYTLPSSSTAEISYAVSSAVLADEDLITTVDAVADAGPYRIAYRSGSDASGEWTFDDTSTTGILGDGTDPYYNQLSGGNWSRTAITSNNRWWCHWLVAWPTYDGTNGIISVMGSTLHTSLAAAQAEDATAIQWGAFSPQEFVVFAKLIYQRLTATTPSNAKLVQVDYVRSTRTSTVLPASAATGIATDATNFNAILSSSDNTVQKALDTIDDSQGYVTYGFDNILHSRLPSYQTAAVANVADRAYFLYVGRTARAITPLYVEFFVGTGGTGAQTAEVGLFSSPAAPNKAAQTLTKIEATGTVDDLTTTGVKRNTNPFSTVVPVGTYLWAGVRFNMATTQPAIWNVGNDMGQGAILGYPAAGALTASASFAAVKIAASMNTGPDLRVTIV
jgi:hypothetical protein